MTEFTLIDRYCRDVGVAHAETRIAVGDDAAVISVPEGMELAISVDTMVEGVHFFPQVDPSKLAHKLLAVNLSDMAAMGAEPKWATLALTLRDANDVWLKAFSESLDQSAKRYGVQLIGGDTTQGPLSLSMQIMGLTPKGAALTRVKAKPGDDVYVTNTIGDAALGLAYLKYDNSSYDNSPYDSTSTGIELDDDRKARLTRALELPEPQIAVGQAILKYAGACIDISDGLVADLSHIAERSSVSIELDVNRIPLSEDYQNYINQGGGLELALTGGDDYQLAFTVASEFAEGIRDLSSSLDISLSKIGVVRERGLEPVSLHASGEDYSLDLAAGYQHFDETKN